MENDEGARHQGQAEPSSATGKPQFPRKIQDLLAQGDALFRSGRFQRAVHVWTRVLFLERGNRAAREAIDRGKRAIAEQERQLDIQALEAARLLDAGERVAARRLVTELLSRDPRHPEGRNLSERLEALSRRGHVAPRPSVPRGAREGAPPARRRRTRSAAPAAYVRPVSPLKIAAFLFCALCLFLAGAVYIHLNWDFLASEGLLSSSRGARTAKAQAAIEEVDVPPLPFPSELHYYNGARLYSKGRYREALSELGRVGRRSPAFKSAESLILRIEERLLRGAATENAPAQLGRGR